MLYGLLSKSWVSGAMWEISLDHLQCLKVRRLKISLYLTQSLVCSYPIFKQGWAQPQFQTHQLRNFSDIGSKKSDMDPDLFIRPDGRPILFLMSESNPERKEVMILTPSNGRTLTSLLLSGQKTRRRRWWRCHGWHSLRDATGAAGVLEEQWDTSPTL